MCGFLLLKFNLRIKSNQRQYYRIIRWYSYFIFLIGLAKKQNLHNIINEYEHT
jgi:hypothetical protein